MSIEQKIAQLMEQAKQLESSDEVVSIEEETAEEVSLDEATSVVGKATKTGADKKGQKLGAMSAAVEGVKTEHEHKGEKYTVHSEVDRDGDVHHSVMHNGKQVHNHLVSQEGMHGDKPSPLHKKLIDDHVKAAKKHLDKMAGHIFSDEDDEDDMYESVTQKIDLGSLFEGEEFSAEFKSKAAELFEAAVEARIKQEIAQIEEEVSQRVVTESAELKEGLVDKVDGYLDYVVEQWMQKNELALDRGIKVEIFESFVSGMKDLFETHYIDVPEEKFDLMESVDAKAKTLEEQVDFLTAQNVELQQKFKLVAKEKQIEEACKELTDLEAERFKQLAEELAYDDEESFGKKLELVKENYISKAKQVKTVVDSVVTDSPVALNEDKQVDASMARYMHAFKAR